jgi:hypothetical protein
MLPRITSNRRYGWVGLFLRRLLNVILWQFDYLHPNRPKFKYLIFAVQLLPVLYYFQLIEDKTKVEVLKQHFFVSNTRQFVFMNRNIFLRDE